MIVNPIQCHMHPFDKKENFFFLHFLSTRAQCAKHIQLLRIDLPEVHLRIPAFLLQNIHGSSPEPASLAALSKIQDRRSGDEGRFHVCLPDLDWNCRVRLR